MLEIDRNDPFVRLVERLRYKNPAVHRHYKTPWPKHCYMPMVVPELLHKKGYKYTVTIDYDVFAADARLLDELDSVKGVGMIRVYPKECWAVREPTTGPGEPLDDWFDRRCWDDEAPQRLEPHERGELLRGYPAFFDRDALALMKNAAGPGGYAFRDGTNYGVLAFNNQRMAAVRWSTWCGAVANATGGYMSGGQDLINLAVGRTDVDVHYLDARHNVQLAFPAEQHQQKASRGWMGAPYCSPRGRTGRGGAAAAATRIVRAIRVAAPRRRRRRG